MDICSTREFIVSICSIYHLRWVKLFNQHDLYTKRDAVYSEVSRLSEYVSSVRGIHTTNIIAHAHAQAHAHVHAHDVRVHVHGHVHVMQSPPRRRSSRCVSTTPRSPTSTCRPRSTSRGDNQATSTREFSPAQYRADGSRKV